jgi:hypothetical protein
MIYERKLAGIIMQKLNHHSDKKKKYYENLTNSWINMLRKRENNILP